MFVRSVIRAPLWTVVAITMAGSAATRAYAAETVKGHGSASKTTNGAMAAAGRERAVAPEAAVHGCRRADVPGIGLVRATDPAQAIVPAPVTGGHDPAIAGVIVGDATVAAAAATSGRRGLAPIYTSAATRRAIAAARPKATAGRIAVTSAPGGEASRPNRRGPADWFPSGSAPIIFAFLARP
jgi:hypothetical protein